LGLPRSNLYRARQKASQPEKPVSGRPQPERALSQEEKEQVCQVLNSARFQDSAPRQVYATLLDEGIYHCSWRTMYRILHENDEVRERRNQLRHPAYSKPELLATKPNQLWSWDITKLKGPVKWTFYYLYVILDVYSRYVVGWLLAERESAALAEQLIAETCAKEGIEPNQLTVHADRGGSMRSKPVALLLADLGVTKTHSRPYTSTDNPYSESQFKTLKYRPGFPERFGSRADARAWVRAFIHWYNHQHRHSSLGLMTPATVHYGEAQSVRAQRQTVLEAAYIAHPERFVKGLPMPPELPGEVWINPPQQNGDGT
jgi:putative transposase